MQNGMMAKVIHTSDAERKLSSGSLRRVDEALSVLRNKIRDGETISSEELEGVL